MATVGHPLSDLCNLLTLFYTARDPATGRHAKPGFLPGQTPGLPTADEVVAWYAQASGYDARADLAWGMAFSIFKLAAVCQGIAARYAARQASSEQARQYAATREPLAELAWKLVREADRRDGERGRL